MNVRAKEKDIRTKKDGLADLSELLSVHSKLLTEKKNVEERVDKNNKALMKELQMFFVELSEKYKRCILINVYDGKIHASVRMRNAEDVSFDLTISRNLGTVTKHLRDAVVDIKAELESILSKAKDGKIEYDVTKSDTETIKPVISLDTRTKYYK